MKNISDQILFENDHYIVLDKPSGVSSLDGRQGDQKSIIRAIKEYHQDAQLCHRLDKETSGILAIAKTPEAYRHLSMQFEHREVVKVYHAITSNTKRFDDVLVEAPILKVQDFVKIDREGKDAATMLQTLQQFRQHTLVACFPITGRTHQIRIHLAHVGNPIAADEQYGGKPIYLSQLKRNFKLKKWTDEQPLMQRVALHAYKIKFADLDLSEIEVVAPYPKDFAALITQLEKNN